ncbi:hypothetical protein Mapa_000853 [Marchantia paleacea]|nr:hypothetical protein Mapa_000853 [Marchantia paleacea]
MADTAYRAFTASSAYTDCTIFINLGSTPWRNSCTEEHPWKHYFTVSHPFVHK